MYLKWTKEKIKVSLIKLANELGHSPSASEVRKKYGNGIVHACKRVFGSFNNAKQSCNLKTWKGTRPYFPIPTFKNPSFEFGYVVGVMLGDGTFFPDKRTISLMVIDKEFAEYFSYNLKKWCGIKNIVITTNHNNRIYYRVLLHSVIIYKFLKKIVDGKNFNGFNFEFKRGLFKGFFDSEGCIHIEHNKKYPRIILSNKNISLLKILKKIANELGFKGGSITGHSTCYNLIFSGFYNLNILLKNIGITIKRKVPKFSFYNIKLKQ